MSIFRFTSLNKRLSVFMLFPVAILLMAMGYAGFIYARKSMLVQWREAAILSLQQEAHQVDMRLSLPKQWMQMFHKVPGEKHSDHHIHDWILDQLRKIEGVESVNLIWVDDQFDRSQRRHMYFNPSASDTQDSLKMRMGDRKR